MESSNIVESDIKTLLRIGQMLREKREELGLSYEKISDITRISIVHLKSMENGDFSNLPNLVFVKGFLKNYTRILAIDPTWMLEEYERIFLGKPEDINLNPVLTQTPNGSTTKSNSFNLFISGVIALVVFFSAIFYFLYIYWNKVDGSGELITLNTITDSSYQPENLKDKNTNEPPIQGANHSVAHKLVEDSEQATNHNEITKEESKVAKGFVDDLKQKSNADGNDNLVIDNIPNQKNSLVDPQQEKVTDISKELKLSSIESGWIRLNIDNKREFDILIKEKQTYTWNANKFFRLTLAKGGLADVFLNGQKKAIKAEELNMFVTLELD